MKRGILTKLVIITECIVFLALIAVFLFGDGQVQTQSPPVQEPEQNTVSISPRIPTPSQTERETLTETAVTAEPVLREPKLPTTAELLVQITAGGEQTVDGILEQLRKAYADIYRTDARACMNAAARMAAMYDYDGAINLIKNYEGYGTVPEMKEAIAEYGQKKSELVLWEDNTEISHGFFHSLIADCSLAFGPTSRTADGYNRYMTTISEFEKILGQLYERGYVLISMHDMAEIEVQDDNTPVMKMKEIYLPEGKIPFVMSQDDLNYYDYMDGEGFANKIVLDENGNPTCEYINADGSIVTGAYDLIPVLDRFIEEHPDFSYRGAKALLCITGYEGALGYETAPYRYDEAEALKSMTEEEKEAMLASERAQCIQTAAVLRLNGYEFASHGYAHLDMQECSEGRYQSDMDRWLEEVAAVIGDTDIYVYPYGADICDWRGYEGAKYEYAVQNGFHYFCNVDSAQYWVQAEEDYLRQGRINFDGERMMRTPEKLVHFYDVNYVLDDLRPAL